VGKSKPRAVAVEAYRSHNDLEKEELIKSYLPLVKKVVHRLSGRLPKDIDMKEMLNSGIIGLVDALEKYNPAHETNFATYAQFRIRGAIFALNKGLVDLPLMRRLPKN
jgi:RNA polymerase sigma factor for flagellar operon FliA